MNCDQKFFKCNHCGNIIGLIYDAGVPMSCCGEKMQLLVANTVDASREKHVPEIAVSGQKVTVKIGSVMHPSLPEHYILFIYLKTDRGGHRVCIGAGQEPVANFVLPEGEKALVAYAYCNLHGLWTAEI